MTPEHATPRPRRAPAKPAPAARTSPPEAATSKSPPEAATPKSSPAPAALARASQAARAARGNAAPQAAPGGLARELARTLPGEPAQAAPAEQAVPAEQAAPTEEVDLAGSGTFEPPEPVAAYLDGQGDKGGLIKVRLGTLARGRLHVRKTPGGYSSGPSHQPLDLTVPVLEPLRTAGLDPVLAVRISDGAVGGYASVHPGGEALPRVDALREAIGEHSAALGWFGLDRLRLPRPVNKLEGGVLTFEVPELTFSVGGFLDGSGRFGFVGEQVTFEAAARGTVRGIGAIELPIRRGPDGVLAGSARVTVSLPRFAGEMLAAFAGGAVDVTGTVRYTTEKLSGELTMVATDAETARGLARERLGLGEPAATGAATGAAAGSAGSGAAPGEQAPAARPKPGPRVLAGWGELDFRFTEWLTGKAKVVVDDKPDVTVVGEITPQKTVELFPQRDLVRSLPPLEARAMYGVPLVGNVFVFVGVRLEALAKLGPGTLSDIRVLGQYSTDPEVGKDFSITGTLTISAFAGLRLRGEGGAGVEILDHDIKAGVGLSALAGVRGYVEATPTIGYREVGDPAAGRKGEFFLKGHLELAAQPFLGLGGDLFVELDSPWWSPAPDKRWTWPLAQLEYPLPGQFGIGADLDYAVGSGKLPDVTFSPVEFNPDRFMTDLLDDHVPARSKGEQEIRGTWQEGPPRAPGAAAPGPATSGTAAPGTAASGTAASGAPAARPPAPGRRPPGSRSSGAPSPGSRSPGPGANGPAGPRPAGTPAAATPAVRGGPPRKDSKAPARPGTPDRPGGAAASGGPQGRGPARGRQEKTDGDVPRPDVQQRWVAGMRAVGELVQRSHRSPLTALDIDAALKSIRRKHGFKRLHAERAGEYWHIHAEMNPSTKDHPAVAKAAPDPAPATGPAAAQQSAAQQSAAQRPQDLHSLHPGMRVVVGGSAEGWFRRLIQRDGTWMVLYRPLRARNDKSDKTVPAILPSGQQNVVRKHGPGMEIERSPDGEKAGWVLAYPLQLTAYQPPRTAPVGWDQLKNKKGNWVQAHLLNGKLGGPGEKWNMVPAPVSVNNAMNRGHEEHLRERAPKEPIMFEAKVTYHQPVPGDHPRLADFPSLIEVSWDYLETGVHRKKPYPVRPPRPDELKPQQP
ncbi:hypothetical protein [Nonomuraea sp. NPDC050783]|uniref:hypothetical protein n=1 Tax=Nonomuraea sp. NPDC050783 TaxID=3154634 RepID=UPI003465B94A